MKIPVLHAIELYVKNARNLFMKKRLLTGKIEDSVRKIIESKRVHKCLLEVFPKLEFLDLDGLHNTYKMLSDSYSKKLFIKLICYKLAKGVRDYKLPLSYVDSKSVRENIKKLYKKDEVIMLSMICHGKEHHYPVNRFDLVVNECPLKIFSSAEAIYINFPQYLSQYNYRNKIKPEKGDYLIDGGAFLGDTALCFAASVGEAGKVFSFEFIPENLNIFKKSLALNPEVAKRISISENALWSNSKDFLYVFENGPGSYCSLTQSDGYTFKVPTKTIDDLVAEENISRVDFIKLDIEGAELPCLEGAQNTIRKFKPKLAVCIYHKSDDFVTIPAYIKKLVPDYDLYLDHYTENEEETVLYAVCKRKN